MHLLGLSRDEAAQSLGTARGRAASVEILACCIDAVRLFALLAGQWRMTLRSVPGPAGPVVISVPTGLDLQGAEAGARWLGLTPDAALLGDLRIMEREALEVMAG